MKSLGAQATLDVRYLGRVAYRDALALQHQLVEQRADGEIDDTLLLLEHPPVITLGTSGTRDDIRVPIERLEAQGVSIEQIERGGEVTYHGPGQLVGYIIVDLRQHVRSLKRFIYSLEQVFIDMLKDRYKLEADRDMEHRGVWVQNEKITAIGVAIRRRITFHGFAFNVAPNLSHFDWIVPCGITDRGQTSVAKLLGRETSVEEVLQPVADAFTTTFGYRSTNPERTQAAL